MSIGVEEEKELWLQYLDEASEIIHEMIDWANDNGIEHPPIQITCYGACRCGCCWRDKHRWYDYYVEKGFKPTRQLPFTRDCMLPLGGR